VISTNIKTVGLPMTKVPTEMLDYREFARRLWILRGERGKNEAWEKVYSTPKGRRYIERKDHEADNTNKSPQYIIL